MSMWESIIDHQTGFVNFTKTLADACRRTPVAVFGCGGNGAVMDHLVGVGFEHFEIVDNDRVEASNLNRLPFGMGEIGFIEFRALDRLVAMGREHSEPLLKQAAGIYPIECSL